MGSYAETETTLKGGGLGVNLVEVIVVSLDGMIFELRQIVFVLSEQLIGHLAYLGER